MRALSGSWSGRREAIAGHVVLAMSTKSGDGNDRYYQCIDLVLSRSATGEATSADVEVSEQPGCGCRTPASPAGLFGLLLLGLRRRSHRSRQA